MTTAAAARRVVLVGNPNTGKTAIFNALTGLSQRVANYPGVTVEKKVGRMRGGFEVVDLPGTYSLAAHSPDEAIAVRVLLGEQQGEPRPDVAVVVADASSLKRSLYLVTQVVEVGVPVVVALNMLDIAARAGISVDVARLRAEIGVPVVPMVASRGTGVRDLIDAISASLDQAPPEPRFRWPVRFEQILDELVASFGGSRVLLTRALVDACGAAEADLEATHGPAFATALRDARLRVGTNGSTPAALEARVRYGWIDSVVAACQEARPVRRSITNRLDALLTHRVHGTLIFVGIMGAMFLSVFEWAAPIMDLISGAFDRLGALIAGALSGTALARGPLESLLVDGVVAGVGSVLTFLPQIVLLFLFIAILEECGYMARTAFLMDRVMRFCGLSGHSFIPMLSSFACAVPGVMAARTIANARERLVTIAVAPLMSCSARIPVYTIMAAAFIPPAMIAGFLPLQGLVFGAMYAVGVLVAIPVAYLLKRTVRKGPPPTFVMVLPPYKVPSTRNVFMRVYERARAFVRQAGTIILAMSVLVWALGYFPRPASISRGAAGARAEARASLSGETLAARLGEIDRREAGENLRESALGKMGRVVEPVVRPLGWDWRIGMATIAAFPAREVIVSTLGVIYDLGEGTSAVARETALASRLRAATWPDGRRVFDVPVALSIMVFFALCCQCGSTVATIKREANSWRWAAFVFGYMTVLAYVAALVTYQAGRAIAG